jgi:hypothetical protein
MNDNIPSQGKPIPIYNSRGEAEAFLAFPYLFNRLGEWIGWVTPDQQVYSVLGVLELSPSVLQEPSSLASPPLLDRRTLSSQQTSLWLL